MFTPFDFDKPRRLRFDIQACMDLEAALGQPLGQIVMQLQSVSITATCAAIWAGCKHEDPTLNVAGVRKRLQKYLDDGGTLKGVNDALNQALVDSTPLKTAEEPAEELEGNATPEPAAIG